ncbi:MAG: trypsin-like peptidase domain-containing protein [Bacteriovoracaceae bacterium]|nr:trypsin-like peptidase domain-containing protein [Bacteriovoracaceae bacterium]
MRFLVYVLCIANLSSCFAKDEVERPIVPKTETPSKVIKEMSDLLDAEKRIINVYHSVVGSVVNVSNIRVSDNFFYGKVEVPQGSGSGFIWNDQGHIVTNFHVVQGGDNFVVTFHDDSKQYKAEVVGVAPKKDIAVLKLKEMPKVLKPVSIGSSKDLLVGQSALALGNPFGLDHSISKGIISALGRKIQGVGGVKIHDMIQTDAAINQGNSGGPLLNSKGELIGMNTMIFSTSGSSSGLGFAVPVDTIKRFVPQLIKHGKVIRPGLGIGILEDTIAERYIGDKGAAISFVDPDGAAAKAGLRGMMRDNYGRIYIGDVITQVGDQKVKGLDDIYHALDQHKIGDTIKVKFLREGKQKTTEVTLQAL